MTPSTARADPTSNDDPTAGRGFPPAVAEQLRLMAVLAHPDDETLGCGGTLARYAAEGVETRVVTCTLGQSGRHGDGPHPGREALGRIRERELRAAAAELGVREVRTLGYMDGTLAEADPRAVLGDLVEILREVRPQVVITFGPEGAYGHPDHIAVSQLATAATVAAADPDAATASPDLPPHRTSKLYYMAWDADTWARYQKAFRTLTTTVDGRERQASPWPEWALTTRIDARPWWRTVWRAVRCHETQMGIYGALESLTEEDHAALWGDQTFYRAFSLVNGGRETETDLFAGLRRPSSVEHA